MNKDISIEEAKELDKFYTNRRVANSCYSLYKKFLVKHKVILDNILFVEPSAGDGAFLEIIEGNKIGFDIKPPTNNKLKILQLDYLTSNIKDVLPKKHKKRPIVILGNPPFGKKSKLAIQFVNKSLEYSNIVGFVVPIQFRKWSVQSKILKNAKLVVDKSLDENSFELMGKPYNVRCCFQIWVRDDFPTKLKDMRMMQSPDLSHPDFEMFQYNRTEGAKKFFKYDWDFGVLRQGYGDYTIKITEQDEIDEKKQWIFFKAKNKTVLKRLLGVDFEKLSKNNIGIPGFGKADMVKEYEEQYEK